MVSNNIASAIKKAKVKSIIQQVFGWIITINCGIISSVGATLGLNKAVNVVMVTLFAVFTVLGVLLIIKGYKLKKLIEQYYDYSARLAADPYKSIDLLSSSIGTTVAIVTKNISDMIALGFFPGAFLDTAHNRVVIQNEKSTASYTAINTQVQTEQTVKYVTVRCKGCGATNKIIVGTVGECEFCGSQISDN